MDFLYWGDRLAADIDTMRGYFGEEHFYLVCASERDLKYRFRSRIRSRLDKVGITRYIAYPYNTDEMYYDEVGERVKRLHSRMHYDIVWMEYYFQSKLFTLFDSDVIKVIHTLDRFAKLNKWFQRIGKVPGWFYLSPKGERTALSRADVVVAIQNDDKRYFEKLLSKQKTRVVTIGHVIEEKERTNCDIDSYGFIGASNVLNIQAMDYYIKHVLPYVREKSPNLLFYIAGAVCKYLPDSSEYIKLGIVSQLEEFYNRVSFVISPLVVETGGLNIKNMEALAYGKPIVTTSISLRQGMADAERAILVSDTSKEFADMVVMLGERKDLRKEMSDEAIEYIRRYNRRNAEGLDAVEDMSKGEIYVS